MNCDEVRELLSPMTDREITPDDLRAIQEHLESCKECAFQSTMMVGMKDLLQRWEGVRASQEFRTKVLERIKKEPPPGLFSRLSVKLWLCVVGVVLATGLAIALVLPGSAPKEPEAKGEPVAAAVRPPEPEGPRDEEPRLRIPEAGVPSEPVAQVLFTEGAVHVSAPGDVSSLGSAGDVLAAGHTIRVHERGRADLLLAGGFEMRVEKGAEFRFGEGPVTGQLLKGRMLLRAEAGEVQTDVLRLSCASMALELGKQDVLCSMEVLEDGAVRAAVADGRARVVLATDAHQLESGRLTEIAADGSVRRSRAEADPEQLDHLRRWGKQ